MGGDLQLQLEKQAASHRSEMQSLQERIQTNQATLEQTSSLDISSFREQRPSEKQSHILSGLQDEQRELQVQMEKYRTMLRDQQKGYLEQVSTLGEEQRELQMQLGMQNVKQKNQQKGHKEDLAQFKETQDSLNEQLARQSGSQREMRAL